ncbi:MAG: hypothetical protein ACJA08_001529 [Cyclobacteriaceae bacterium]|jgi:hypothetical protein
MQRKLNDSFIDQYCGRFSEKITTGFFKDHSSISGKEILNLTPSRQINFYVLKILFINWQDEMKKLESPYFNFKNAEVRKAMIAFMNILSQKIEIEQASFEPLLENATKEMLLFLADPNSFMEKEFSANLNGLISEKAAKTFLKYQKVFKEEFENLLGAHIDDSIGGMLAEAGEVFQSDEWLETAAFELSILNEIESISLADLYEIDEPEDAVFALDEEETVIESEPEVEAIEEATADSVVEEFLEEDQPPEGEEEISDDVNDSKEEDLEEEMVEQDEESESLEKDEESEELDEEDSDDQEDIEEERHIDESEDIQSEDETSDEDEIEEDLTSEIEEEEWIPLNEKLSDGTAKIVNERFEENNVTLADQLQQTKVSSIMDAISINNRYMFTSVLFDGEKEQFEGAIQTMENCQSFDDAVEILVQDFAKTYDWDMNSDEVKELLKVIFRKFR